MASFSKRVLVSMFLICSGIRPELPGADMSTANRPVKFRPDDPLLREPHPKAFGKPATRDVNPLTDFVENSFARGTVVTPPEAHAFGINTLDEVPDSLWFTNRHGSKRMSKEELIRGPGNANPPRGDAPWRILAAKSDGVTPGLLIQDASGSKYLLKFDPPRNAEMASAADIIGSKLFYALGYSTPENYIVQFERTQLAIDGKATWRDAAGRARPLTEGHVDSLLRDQKRNAAGQYRALASRYIPNAIGPFRYSGTRTDDPNDLIPHEDRRDLRGLAVLAAWVNHTDAKSLNTLDALVEANGGHYIRHYLIDFGASLGSDSFAPKDARLGHEYFVDPKPTLMQIATLGLYVPRWARVRYPNLPAVGRFSAEGFHPETWKPNYPNSAFLRMQPADAFWAARLVMSFSDDDIRAIVSTGQYSDSRAAEYVAKTLCARRDAIGKTWLRQYLPVDKFTVDNSRLTFEDLLARPGIGMARPYSVSWAIYDNRRSEVVPVESATDFFIPGPVLGLAPGEYAAATIRYASPSSSEAKSATTVYLRREAQQWRPVGIERKQ